mmetsp:Transcript_124351/g.194818  ORF Transcript_124351/g.194818 Transcript_124351/m.194818 type:complete len:634 (+) Transcript_124351:90-1991(+)|eukprot:CAMPEP_0169216638 /NCGR_PEP_ID=MMETSP1016-20121227/18489_1 /TAXON_ID=342587 /ORGANISM="Karlodinium micrum, Strain CCMP2283" /LENGTH=633 /DNA_ID=CAMNT_0009294527 /DNA_START=43 /DNA_END=1944 /DNA_ORIENTATION=+
MGCGKSKDRGADVKECQTAPEPCAEDADGFSIVPGSSAQKLASGHAPQLFSQRVPSAWQVQEVLSSDEVKALWDKHGCTEESSIPADPLPDKMIKRAPMRVALNVMPAWEESDFELQPGCVIMGRYKVQAEVDQTSKTFEVIDTVDGTACVLQVQTPTPVSEVLQALAKHEALRKSSASNNFLLYKDALVAPSGHWAVIVEQKRSSLKSHVLSGKSSGEALLAQLGQIASAILQGMLELHGACWVHADISIENIVCGADGCWKLAGLENAKAQPKGGGGVAPRAPAPGRFRPPEVLLGFPSDEKSDVFDLGIALLEAAMGVQLMEVQSTSPSLFEEFDQIIRRFGPIPQGLWSRSPWKESVGLPDGRFLRPAKRGTKDVKEALSSSPPSDGTSFAHDLEQGRMSGQSPLFQECRNFIKKLLSLDPKDRYSPAEALADNFLKQLAKEGKMKRVSMSRQTEASGPTVIEVLDDEEITQLLQEGEGELALLNQGALAETDEPIDTQRRLSNAKIDTAGVSGNSRSRKTAVYSEKANEVHTFVSSALTMLPGTVEDQGERHAHVDEEEGAHDIPRRINRQQTGFVRNMHKNSADDLPDEGEKHAKISEPIDDGHVSKVIARRKTGFVRHIDVESDDD